MKNYTIREMKESEYILLDEFLYQAIFQKENEDKLPKKIIYKPELYMFIENFGKYENDFCFCAEIDKKIIGAVWVRTINGYGHIDKDTPEFSISLLEEYRGQGIGYELMSRMLIFLGEQGYKKTSLSVQKENYAVKLYKKVGFKIFKETEEEYIMIYRFD